MSSVTICWCHRNRASEGSAIPPGSHSLCVCVCVCVCGVCGGGGGGQEVGLPPSVPFFRLLSLSLSLSLWLSLSLSLSLGFVSQCYSCLAKESECE